MNALFQQKEHQQTLEEKGFLHLPLIGEEAIKELLNYYRSSNPDNKIEGGFHISLDNTNENWVKEVGAKITGIVSPAIEGLFDNARLFTASYVIKEPGLKNIVPPHQDWTFVDEDHFVSVTVWIPLVDVNEENGALAVIPGSHRLFKHVRSSPSPQSKSPLADHIFTLFPFVEVIEMKAGECLIFDNRLLHASPPNLSGEARIAVGVGLTQQEAQLKHYYQVPESDPVLLNEYAVEEDFFTYFNNKRLASLYEAGKEPEGLKKIRSLEREVPSLSKEEMEALIQTLPDIRYNKELMDKLARLFNYESDKREMKEEIKEEEKVREQEGAPTIEEENGVYYDNRNFFQKYTPLNIMREIAWRLKGRP
jgi:hypothetical protein